MNKHVLTGLILLLQLSVFAQTTEFQAAMDSGKAAFKAEMNKDTADYSKACTWLTRAVSLQPTNAEARYFLGYTLDRMNSSDGRTMLISGRELAIRASEQFEKVCQLEPDYKGEILLLDPYSKITTTWGCLAQAYLIQGKPDSAHWAFTEGEKRGGFIGPILDYNRQLLMSCDSNALLFMSGDYLTIPVWYLQEMEHVRPDITAIDINLLNTGWYPKYLKHTKQLSMSYSDVEIDTVEYVSWIPTEIHIKHDQQEFSWLLKPTYNGRYLLRGDRLALDILQKNLFLRPCYFSATLDSVQQLFLMDQLGNEGLVNRILLQPCDTTVSRSLCLKNLSSYSISRVPKEEILHSKDAINLLNTFRYVYHLNGYYYYYIMGNRKLAKTLMTDMEQKFNPAELPYVSDGARQSIETFYNTLRAN